MPESARPQPPRSSSWQVAVYWSSAGLGGAGSRAPNTDVGQLAGRGPSPLPATSSPHADDPYAGRGPSPLPATSSPHADDPYAGGPQGPPAGSRALTAVSD